MNDERDLKREDKNKKRNDGDDDDDGEEGGIFDTIFQFVEKILGR